MCITYLITSLVKSHKAKKANEGEANDQGARMEYGQPGAPQPNSVPQYNGAPQYNGNGAPQYNGGHYKEEYQQNGHQWYE